MSRMLRFDVEIRNVATEINEVSTDSWLRFDVEIRNVATTPVVLGAT